ncbi:6-bladed beta-propeller [Sphingobacterium hungaricum]
MKKFFFILALLSTSLFCYAQRLIHDPAIPVVKSRIIIEQMRGGTVSENLSDLEYIPLKGGKNDVIDYISNSAFTKNRFAIINNEDGNLFVYDENGALLNRVSKLEGYKPKDKRLFHAVYFQENKFVVYSERLKATFDLDGNLIEKDLNFEHKVSIPSIDLGQTRFLFGEAQVKRDSFPEFALKMNDSILIRYDTRDTIGSLFYQGEPLVKISEDKAFAVFSSTYRMFELDPNGISKIHQFIFPFKNTIDTSSFDIYKDFRTLYDYLNKNHEKVYGVGRPMLYKNYMILHIGSFRLASWIAYNLETHEILSLKKILPDKSNDFLEFLDNNNLSTDGEYLYSLIFPNAIQRAKDKSREEEHTMRKEFLNLEKSLNPILVRFKLN